MNLVTSTGHTNLDIDVNANLELVEMFCYLHLCLHMLSVDRDGDAPMEIRICIGWNKFRQLVPILTRIYH